MDAAVIISQYKQQILDRWIDKVKNSVKNAERLPTPIIKNNVPKLLDALVESLQADDERDFVYSSESHGHERVHYTSFELKNLITEYRLLKEVIFTVIDEHGDNIEIRERDGIMFAIDQALEQAAEVFFVEHRRADRQERQKAEDLSKKLSKQDAFRDRFVATLSHDLRGPLNNTQQLIELLKDRMDTDDDFTLQILNKISLSLKRGNQLIANLLDVGRIQSDGKIPIQRKNSDLISEIRDSVDMLSPAVRRRLRFVHEDDHLPGRFDTDALRRATDNLINNAVKYGEAESKITLRIMQEKYQALISVHNHGEAIPEEKLHRLFELYYRVEDSHVQKGWGLGLTLVKGIAEAHGGKVEAMSHPKDGTTFTMTIPKT